MNGVLDEYHLPKKNAHEESFAFRSEIEELSQKVNYKKKMANLMTGMNGIKLNSMVSNLKERLGFINRKVSTEMAVNKLCEELSV